MWFLRINGSTSCIADSGDQLRAEPVRWKTKGPAGDKSCKMIFHLKALKTLVQRSIVHAADTKPMHLNTPSGVISLVTAR
mmetsp:Transcript_20899/g.39278  ORF Transcript_20899/g.39278 Transcript_20899/m.39278 type:complete len:80 (-) Transcript_20899:131-370(-)